MADIIKEAIEDIEAIKRAAEKVATKRLVETVMPEVRDFIRSRLSEATEDNVEKDDTEKTLDASEGETDIIKVELIPAEEESSEAGLEPTPEAMPAAEMPSEEPASSEEDLGGDMSLPPLPSSEPTEEMPAEEPAPPPGEEEVGTAPSVASAPPAPAGDEGAPQEEDFSGWETEPSPPEEDEKEKFAEAIAYAFEALTRKGELSKDSDAPVERRSVKRPVRAMEGKVLRVTEAELREAVRTALKEVTFPKDDDGLETREPHEKRRGLPLDDTDDYFEDVLPPARRKDWIPESRRLRKEALLRRLAEARRRRLQLEAMEADEPMVDEADEVDVDRLTVAEARKKAKAKAAAKAKAPKAKEEKVEEARALRREAIERIRTRRALAEAHLVNHQMGLLLRAQSQFGLKKSQVKALAEALEKASNKTEANSIYGLFERKMKSKNSSLVSESRKKELVNESQKPDLDVERIRKLIGLRD